MERIFTIIKQAVGVLGDNSYLLIGSTNLMLQGVNVSSKDIDILTSDKGVRLYARHCGTIIETEKPEMYIRTTNFVEGWRFEVISYEKNVLRQGFSGFITIYNKNKSIGIRCARLEVELKFYTSLNRKKDKDKILKIHQYLNQSLQSI